MSVSGICQVCEAAEGKHTCKRCGSLVCNEHWDRTARACLACAEGGGDGDRPDGFTID